MVRGDFCQDLQAHIEQFLFLLLGEGSILAGMIQENSHEPRRWRLRSAVTTRPLNCRKSPIDSIWRPWDANWIAKGTAFFFPKRQDFLGSGLQKPDLGSREKNHQDKEDSVDR